MFWKELSVGYVLPLLEGGEEKVIKERCGFVFVGMGSSVTFGVRPWATSNFFLFIFLLLFAIVRCRLGFLTLSHSMTSPSTKKCTLCDFLIS